MFHIRNAVRITKYLIFSALTLSTGCVTAAGVQIGENRKEDLSHFSSRSLLYSWDDNSKFRDNYSDGGEKFFVIVASVVIFVIAVICKCCWKYGCEVSEPENIYSRTVLHTPPRTAGAVVPPPSNYGSSPGLHSSNLGRASSGSTLAPPRTSRSIILPFEGDTFPSHLYGIDNPNYRRINANSEQYYNAIAPMPESTRSQNQTPLCDILDMPPSYDTVVKEGLRYPKPTGKS